MHKHFKRLALAFAISLASLIGTLSWYYAGVGVRRGGEGKDAVARLTERTDEVQRKEASRVIWETVGLNDDLFNGEAVRTGAKSSAKVRLNSGAVIHLEPDSLVVLEQNANGLSLDFLEGNLFIQGGGDAKSGLTLKTDKGEITMNSADVSLSRGKAGEVDLEVYRGQLELNQGGKKTALTQDKAATLSEGGVRERRDQLRLTAPRAGDNVPLNFVKNEKLEVTWTPLAPGYRVFIEIGPTRGALSRRAGAGFDGTLGRGTLDLKPGPWLVRLKAEAAGQPELASLVTPFVISARVPPALIEPTADVPVLRATPDQVTRFRWLNRDAFEAQSFEVASDEAFKKVIHREDLGAAATDTNFKLTDGAYYWRVTGFAKRKGLSSAVARVRIGAPLEQRAQLKSPAQRARIPAAVAAERGVQFAWGPDAAAKPYVIDLRPADGGPSLLHVESSNGQALAKDLAPGIYRWSVTTADTQSETFEFTVTETPRLAVTSGADYAYVTPQPTVAVEWQHVPGATYRYRVTPDSDGAAPGEWITAKQNKIMTPVAADGTYRVDVEARDAKNSVIAAAPAHAVNVRRRPLLAAPRWTGAGPTFSADASGNVTLNWDVVNGAREYVLDIEDPGGRRVRRKFARGPASFTNLKPGQYQLKVKGVDEFARDGDQSPPRVLEVPNTSDIQAPRIKGYKVK